MYVYVYGLDDGGWGCIMAVWMDGWLAGWLDGWTYFGSIFC